jgi:hypothetical protein
MGSFYMSSMENITRSFLQNPVIQSISEGKQKLSKQIDKFFNCGNASLSETAREQASTIYHDLRPKIFDTNYIPDTSFSLSHVKHWVAHLLDQHKYDKHTLDGSTFKSQIKHLNDAVDSWKNEYAHTADPTMTTKMNTLQSTLEAGKNFEEEIVAIRNPKNFENKGQLQTQLAEKLHKQITSLTVGKQILLPCSISFDSSDYSHAFAISIQKTDNNNFKLEIINTQKDYVEENHLTSNGKIVRFEDGKLPSLLYKTKDIDKELINHLIIQQTGQPDSKKNCTACKNMKIFYSGIKKNMENHNVSPEHGTYYKEQGPVGICSAKCLSVWAHIYLRNQTKSETSLSGEIAYKQIRLINLKKGKEFLKNTSTQQAIKNAPIRFKNTDMVKESDLSNNITQDTSLIRSKMQVTKNQPALYGGQKVDADMLKTSYKTDFISKQLDIKIEKTAQKIISIKNSRN